MDVYDAVREFVLQKIAGAEDAALLTRDTPLDEMGLLDSLSTLKLLSFLEERFEIELDSADVDARSFSSLGHIERLVQNKISARR